MSSSKWINSTLTKSSSISTLTVTLATLTNKDILSYNGSKWVNTVDLTNVENSITNLQLSSGIIKNNNATAQYTTIITNYIEGSDVNIININNSTHYYNTLNWL